MKLLSMSFLLLMLTSCSIEIKYETTMIDKNSLRGASIAELMKNNAIYESYVRCVTELEKRQSS